MINTRFAIVVVAIIVASTAFGLFFLKQFKNEVGRNEGARLNAVMTVQKQELGAKSVSSQQKTIRGAFLAISSNKSSDENLRSLALLALALRSEIVPLQQTAIPLAGSLAIDAAHGEMPVDSQNHDALNEVLKIYRDVATREIADRRAGFPHSPTIKFLEEL